MNDELRSVLDEVAGQILDRGPGAPVDSEREDLLRGAALLTGRAETAQDATHVGMARARLDPGEEPEPRRLRTEVTRASRVVAPPG